MGEGKRKFIVWALFSNDLTLVIAGDKEKVIKKSVILNLIEVLTDKEDGRIKLYLIY